jgi:hypothetical protein
MPPKHGRGFQGGRGAGRCGLINPADQAPIVAPHPPSLPSSSASDAISSAGSDDHPAIPVAVGPPLGPCARTTTFFLSLPPHAFPAYVGQEGACLACLLPVAIHPDAVAAPTFQQLAAADAALGAAPAAHMAPPAALADAPVFPALPIFAAAPADPLAPLAPLAVGAVPAALPAGPAPALAGVFAGGVFHAIAAPAARAPDVLPAGAVHAMPQGAAVPLAPLFPPPAPFHPVPQPQASGAPQPVDHLLRAGPHLCPVLSPEDLLRDIVRNWSAFGFLSFDRDLVDRAFADVLAVMFCGAPGVAMCGTIAEGTYLSRSWRYRDPLSHDESVALGASIHRILSLGRAVICILRAEARFRWQGTPHEVRLMRWSSSMSAEVHCADLILRERASPPIGQVLPDAFLLESSEHVLWWGLLACSLPISMFSVYMRECWRRHVAAFMTLHATEVCDAGVWSSKYRSGSRATALLGPSPSDTVGPSTSDPFRHSVFNAVGPVKSNRHNPVNRHKGGQGSNRSYGGNHPQPQGGRAGRGRFGGRGRGGGGGGSGHSGGSGGGGRGTSHPPA